MLSLRLGLRDGFDSRTWSCRGRLGNGWAKGGDDPVQPTHDHALFETCCVRRRCNS